MIAFCNVSCANIYSKATFHSEVESQAVLWEVLDILEQDGNFFRVRCEDGYEGWINKFQIVFSEQNDFDPKTVKMVFTRIAYIYENLKKDTIIRDSVCGSYLQPISEQNDLIKIRLPDGLQGWVEAKIFQVAFSYTRQEFLTLAKSFLGIPYFWGGKSPKGFDCSGYVQMLHKITGKKIRRDSPMQFEDARLVSKDPFKGKPGDLLFFSESGERITHVGIKLNEKQLIHARGIVRINSLAEGDRDFDPNLKEKFVAVKTFWVD